MIAGMTRTTLLLAFWPALVACSGDPKPTPADDTLPDGESGVPDGEDSGAETADGEDTATEVIPDPCADVSWPAVTLNELVAANLAGLADGSGETSDWIELVSRAGEDVDLSGWSLVDADDNAWTFAPLTLSPGEVLLLWADGQDSQGDPDAGGEIHLGFKLSAEDAGLRLLAPDGCVWDEALPGRLYGDISFGRASDDRAWEYFLEPTPGAENTTESRPGFAQTPTISPASGFYGADVEVSLSSEEVGAALYLSLDGSAPEDDDTPYTAPFTVDGSTQPAVVRARAYVDGLWPSRVESATYSEDSTLPAAGMYIVSLIVEPDDLFSEDRGIYAYGPADYEPWYPYFGANFWEDWERPVRVQIWDREGDLVVDQDAGIAIHGGYTRAFDQKSLRLYARSAYGPGSFEGRFFDTEEIDEFQTLVLQIGMDWCSTHLQEVTLPTLLRDADGALLPGADVAAWEPAQVWLNGEYWGYYNLRERMDGDWIQAHHGYDADALDRVELGWTHDPNWELEQGSWDNFDALNAFVETADLSDPETWEAFDAFVDLDNLATAMIAEAWIGNTDWWYNNLRLWRPQEEGGQWRWMAYDFGHGWTSMDYDQIGYSVTWSGDGLPIADALENEAFRVLLANHASDLLNTALQGDAAQAAFDAMKTEIQPAMEPHFDRWCDGSLPTWYTGINHARTFVKLREDVLRDDVQDALGLEGTAALSLESSPEGGGRFALTAVTVDAPFTGTFYTGIPVTITATPAEGFRFVGWEDAALGDEATIAVELDGDAELTALFEAE